MMRTTGNPGLKVHPDTVPSVSDELPINISETQAPIIRPDIARFLCGGIAGAVSRTITAPLDRVKVMRQIGSPDLVGQNMIRSLRIMISEGGVLSLWRGNGVNVLKNCPESAIRFGLHSWLKPIIFPEASSHLEPGQRLVVASIAGATSLTSTYPIELIKTRMAMRSSSDPSSIWSCVKRVYRQGGLLGFYRGYRISMMSYVPYSGMELALYEMTKRRYLQYRASCNGGDTVPIPVSIGIIFFSSFVPILIIYPANLLRTRYQASENPRAAPILSSLRAIVRTKGPLGLYNGLVASLSKTLPSVCITYLVVEFTSKLLRVPGLGSR